MSRAAIYARFSTEMQNARSIEDQIALCRNSAKRDGILVVATFEDRARSGASVLGRNGLMSLMEAARNGQFDIVIVEALDRLSRDQEDLAGIWKRLRFLGIELRTVHEGSADEIQIGVRGLVGALYLQDLAHKVRRGMSGVVKEGRHPGGRAYGYRAVPGKPGSLEIVQEEAEIVREIFERYVGGETPREIAADLNNRKVAPPRGRFWSASAINGSLKRHNGLLVNELYVGRIVWNKVRMVKNPDTGRRVSRPNPPSEWQRIDAPHLQIVDQDMFDRAQKIKRTRGGSRPHNSRKPKHLMSGLLKCGSCGAGMSVKDHDHGRTRIQCTQMKEAGTCDNRRAYYLDTIERTVLDGLRENLQDPHLIAEYAEAYNAERKRLARSLQSEKANLQKKLARTERELDRAVDAIIKGLVEPETLREKLKTLEEDKRRYSLELEKADVPADVISLHPTALQRYREQIEDLQKTLSGAIRAEEREPIAAFRSLVESVVVAPTKTPSDPLNIEVKGRLAALLAHDLFPQAAFSGGTMVAEEGLEPPTRGL